jgi:hypothetical protein
MTIMSAAFALEVERSLKLILDQEQPPQCRFCGCTEFTPCAIPTAEDPDGTVRLARSEEEVSNVLPCSWYIDRVCNAPACVEKLIAESRGELGVLLFDAAGRKISPAQLVDLAADDRDFTLIGRELGIRPEELSREVILDRIRELRRSAGLGDLA